VISEFDRLFLVSKAEYHMLIVNINNHGLPRGRIYRLLLMLFLVLVTFYPIFDAALDAYSDHLTHPLRMTPDDRVCSARHHHTPKSIALFQRVSVPSTEDPAFHFFRTRPIPAVAMKSFQSYLPASSDLSPPVV
jgi:hypothetical protein